MSTAHIFASVILIVPTISLLIRPAVGIWFMRWASAGPKGRVEVWLVLFVVERVALVSCVWLALFIRHPAWPCLSVLAFSLAVYATRRLIVWRERRATSGGSSDDGTFVRSR
jgi:hypothetical protein